MEAGSPSAPAFREENLLDEAFETMESDDSENFKKLNSKIFACGILGEARGAKPRNLNATKLNSFSYKISWRVGRTSVLTIPTGC